MCYDICIHPDCAKSSIELYGERGFRIACKCTENVYRVPCEDCWNTRPEWAKVRKSNIQEVDEDTESKFRLNVSDTKEEITREDPQGA